MEDTEIILASWSGDRPGLNKAEITIRFNRPILTPGDVITWDYRNGMSLVVTNIDGGVATCRLADGYAEESWVPENRLEPNTMYYKIN
jgi:hypothetical protein